MRPGVHLCIFFLWFWLNKSTVQLKLHVLCQRPYQDECTASRSISVVKHLWVWSVLGWVTAWEHQMLLAFLFLFYFSIYWPYFNKYDAIFLQDNSSCGGATQKYIVWSLVFCIPSLDRYFIRRTWLVFERGLPTEKYSHKYLTVKNIEFFIILLCIVITWIFHNLLNHTNRPKKGTNHLFQIAHYVANRKLQHFFSQALLKKINSTFA